MAALTLDGANTVKPESANINANVERLSLQTRDGTALSFDEYLIVYLLVEPALSWR